MTENTESPPQIEGHPIRYIIAGLIKDGAPTGGEPAVFDDEALKSISAEIKRSIGTPDLVDCVEMVLAVATHLEMQQKSPIAANALYLLVENDEIVDALKDLNRKKDEDRAEDVAKAADKFSGFTGGETGKKAPKGDEKAPKGSIKLGNLDFPKKL